MAAVSGRLARLVRESAPPMRRSARTLLEALARRADDGTGELRWPVGTAQLRVETAYSERQLRRARRELEELGLLMAELGDGRERTRYALVLDRLLDAGVGVVHPGEDRAAHPGEPLMPPVNPADPPGESAALTGHHVPPGGQPCPPPGGPSCPPSGAGVSPPTRAGARAPARAQRLYEVPSTPPYPHTGQAGVGGQLCPHGRHPASGGCRACATNPRTRAAADRAASLAEQRRAQLAARVERERAAAAAAAVAPAGAAAARAALTRARAGVTA